MPAQARSALTVESTSRIAAAPGAKLLGPDSEKITGPNRPTDRPSGDRPREVKQDVSRRPGRGRVRDRHKGERGGGRDGGRGRKAAMQQLFCPKFGLTVFFRVRLGGLAVCCSLAPSFSRLLPVLCCAVYVRVCVCVYHLA